MTFKRLMIIVGVLVFLAGGGIMWLWQYAYTPQGRARVIIAQVKNDTSLRGWMVQHHVVRPGFTEPNQDGPSPEQAMKFLDDRDHAAADGLVKLGPEGLLLAIEALKDGSHYARHAGILACGEFRDPSAIHPLVQCMRAAAHDTPGAHSPPRPSSHDLEIQQWCMESLVEIGPPAYGPLLEASKRCWMEVGYTIPRVIVQKWGAAAFPQLLKLLDDTDPAKARAGVATPRDDYAQDIVTNVRCEIVIQLGKFKDPRAIDAIAARLKDPDWGVAMYAPGALAQIGGPKADSVLLKAIDDPQIDKTVRMQAAGKVGAIGKGKGVKFLLAQLQSANSAERQHAAQELGLAGIKEAFDPLIALLDDKDFGVRLEAVRALWLLRDPRAIPALTKLLKDPSSYVRSEAAKALKDLGAKSP